MKAKDAKKQIEKKKGGKTVKEQEKAQEINDTLLDSVQGGVSPLPGSPLAMKKK